MLLIEPVLLPNGKRWRIGISPSNWEQWVSATRPASHGFRTCVRVCLSLHVRVCVGGGACKRFALASERACVRACESPLKMTQNAQERGE